MELDGTLRGRANPQGGEALVGRGRWAARTMNLNRLSTAAWVVVAVGLVAMIVALFSSGPVPGGAVSGGGSIASGPGSYAPDPTLSGPAQFTLEASSEAGGSSPQGRVTLVLPAADFSFASTACDWVSLSGETVKVAGTGTVNGGGDYRFLLTAADRSNGDGLHLAVWDRDTDTIVYDNEPSVGLHSLYPDVAGLTGGAIEVRQ